MDRHLATVPGECIGGIVDEPFHARFDSDYGGGRKPDLEVLGVKRDRIISHRPLLSRPTVSPGARRPLVLLLVSQLSKPVLSKGSSLDDNDLDSEVLVLTSWMPTALGRISSTSAATSFGRPGRARSTSKYRTNARSRPPLYIVCGHPIVTCVSPFTRTGLGGHLLSSITRYISIKIV